jgi:WD40 repeat protein
MSYKGESNVSAVLVLKGEFHPIQYVIGEGTALKIFDSKLALMRTLTGHKGKIISIDYRDYRVYSADSVGVCNVWNVRDDFKWIQTVKRQSSFSTFALSPDGSRFVGGFNLGGLHSSILDVWDADTLLHQYAYPGLDGRGVYSSTFFRSNGANGSYDPNTVVVGGYGAVHIFSTTEQMHVTSFSAHSGPVLSLALWYGSRATDTEHEWRRDHASLLVTGGEDKRILLWDAVDFTAELFRSAAGAKRQRFCGHQSAVTHLQTTHISQYGVVIDVLCSGSRDRTVRTWDLATGAQLWLFNECSAAVTALHLITLVVQSPIKPSTITLTPPTHSSVSMAVCFNTGLVRVVDLSAELMFLRRRLFLQFLCGYDLLPLQEREVYTVGEMETASAASPSADGLDDLSSMMPQMYRQNNADGPVCACLSLDDLCRCISSFI